MKKILLALGILGLGLAPALAADPGPEAVVKKLYAEPHPNHSAVYSKRLQGLFDADAKQANGAAGNLDFDFRLNGEPLKPDTVKALTFKEATEGQDQAKVTVERKGGDGSKSIVYDLVREDGSWKVSDAHAIGDRKWQLSTILKGEAH
ncbi:YbjP/YqhG family protein [Methylobacterium sp. J-070]|uniref:YbjP/YqhG family protein n=1 Tax=Methylobacterium sp. J-070 TaxID=2836650 RepID=UPI001FB890C3|nr:YbjP/YqhG family protein [Methylobacterium sp. J-070]MCJ2050985.1 YbjP/YqhG family protein [Methylobacterium sp. J-070]